MPRASERRENRKAPVAIGKRHVGDLVRSSACLRDRARFRWGTGERASGEDGRGRGQAPAPLSRTRVQAGDYVFSSVTIIAVTEEFPVRWHAPRGLPRTTPVLPLDAAPPGDPSGPGTRGPGPAGETTLGREGLLRPTGAATQGVGLSGAPAPARGRRTGVGPVSQ